MIDSMTWSVSPENLAELQQWMRWVITHPAGPKKALQTPPSPRKPADPAMPLEVLNDVPANAFDVDAAPRFYEPQPRRWADVKGPSTRERLTRLSVYADAYFIRIMESLAADFPTLYGVLGPQLFPRLTADYLMRYPSSTANVNDIGHALARFLETHPFSAEFPYLADTAQLEWNVLRSLFAERLPAFDPSSLAHVPAEAWDTVTLVLDPTVRLLGTEWAVDLLWKDRFLPEPDGRRMLLRKNRRWLVLYRNDAWIQVLSVEGAEWFALERCQEGAPLGQLCHDLEELLPDAQPLPISEWMERWIRLGLLKGITRRSAL